MRQGDIVEFPCGASAKVIILETRSVVGEGLAVVELRGLQGTKLITGDTLEVRFQSKTIPALITALTAIQRELNRN